MSAPIILQEDEYVWISETDSGNVILVEGPLRLTMKPNQALFGNKSKKVVLRENEYVIVKNPFSKSAGACIMGEREVRCGPSIFSIYPSEVLETSILKAYILTNNEALVVQALDDFVDSNKVQRRAGELYSIRGPTKFIPTKNEKVVRKTDGINVRANAAIYVINTTTAALKMVTGPVTYLLDVDEELYQKKFRKEEYQALELQAKPSHEAPVVQVQKGEMLCIIDYQLNREEYINGPKTIIIGPHQGIKTVSISGGVPKQENMYQAGVIRIGPDYMFDKFTIRTKDNAVLTVHISYKWRFVIDESAMYKIFAGDFTGYPCQSMKSRIRDEAAKHNFEDFHTNSAKILRNRLFKQYQVELVADGQKTKSEVYGRYFNELSLLIFELDVKEITPVDAEIAQLLNESIKANMKILCRKLEDSAQFQADKEKIESQAEIAKLKRNLIVIENANFTKSTIEKAKIEGEALVEQARAQKQATELLEKSKADLELKGMKQMLELLGTPEGARFLEFQKIQNLHKNVAHATVIPADTKTLFLGSGHSASTAHSEYE